MTANDAQDTDLEATDDLADDLEIDADEAGDLTPSEALFCLCYANTDSRDFGRRTQAARTAGYSQPRSAGLKLVKRPHVKKRLAVLHEAAAATIGHVMANLEHIRLLAEAKGDLRVACRATELQGKHLAAFSDAMLIDVPRRREYTEAERREAMRLGNLLLKEETEEERLALDAALAAEDALADAPEGGDGGGDGDGSEDAGT